MWRDLWQSPAAGGKKPVGNPCQRLGKLLQSSARMNRPRVPWIIVLHHKPCFGSSVHTAAVDSARSGRMAIVKMFSGLVPVTPGS